MYYYNINSAVGFYQSYLTMLLYTNVYFQELSLIDTSYDSKDGDTSCYNNPYFSKYLGNRQIILNSKDNPTQIGPQNAGKTLLYQLQSFYNYSKDSSKQVGFLAYINKTFNLYFNNLEFKDEQKCCKAYNSYSCMDECCQYCRGAYTGNCEIKKPCEHTLSFTDKNEIFNNKDVETGLTWYEAMSGKYDDKMYAKSLTNMVYGKFDVQSTFTKYLTYFNESLDFPLDTYIKYAKMAGYILTIEGTQTEITGTDLFKNILYELYFEDGKGNKKDTTKFNITDRWEKISIKIKYDPEGGYPFGLDRPSYREGIMAYSYPETSLNPTVQKIDFFNTYCTPLVAITPSNTVDATPLKIAGDPNKDNGFYDSKNLYCEDPNADSIKSCLLPGKTPGKLDLYTQNSRKGYCFDTKTNNVSELTITKPNWTFPTPPPIPQYKCWNLKAKNVNGKEDLVIISLFIWPDNGNAYYHLNDDPLSNEKLIAGTTTMTFDSVNVDPENHEIRNCSLTFGQGETILGGNLGMNSDGSYTTFDNKIPIPSYITQQPLLPPSPNLYQWILKTSKNQIFKLRLDSQGVYTIDDQPVNVTWKNLTIILSNNPKISTGSSWSLTFGENDSIIKAIGMDGTNPINFITPFIPTLIPPQKPVSPIFNLNTTKPTWRIENRSLHCSFDYEVYINGNKVLQGKTTTTDGDWKSPTYTANGGDVLEFKAQADHRNTRWVSWTRNLEIGHDYRIYNDCSCYYSGDPCINIKKNGEPGY
jgi:hypothetical protein